MKKSVAMKWVNALRSGKYKQGTGSLKITVGNKVKHCCLGVLCEILNKNPDNLDINYDGLLTQEIQNLAGMNHKQSFANGNDLDLASYNDDDHSFDEIADIIQLLYKEL